MMLKNLKHVSAFPRPDEHLVQKTAHGAVVSIAGLALMAVLFLSELFTFLSPMDKNSMSVDTSIRDKVKLNFDITFARIPCAILEVDRHEAMGETERDLDHDLYKTRLSSAGWRIGNAVKVEVQSEMVITLTSQGIFMMPAGVTDEAGMKEVSTELSHNEGCRIQGSLGLRYVKGMLQFGVNPSLASTLVSQVYRGDASKVDITHTIHDLSFGVPFPGKKSPLRNYSKQGNPANTTSVNYFSQVVPTTFVTRFGRQIQSHQYSVTEYEENFNAERMITPKVTLQYDFSPIKVVIDDEEKHFLHFLVRLCAVVGGAFAVTALFDQLLYRSFTAASKKPRPNIPTQYS